MKAEPDRLDLLIVAIPVILLSVLGVQIYRYVQMSGERAEGAELALRMAQRATAPGDEPASAPEAAAALDDGETTAPPEEAAGAESDGERGPAAAGGDAAPVGGEPEPAPSGTGDAVAGKAPASPETGPAAAGEGPAGAGPTVAAANPPQAGDGGETPEGDSGAPPRRPAAAGAIVTGAPPPPAAVDEPPAGGADASSGADGAATPAADGPAEDPVDVDPGGPAVITMVPGMDPPRVAQVLPVEVHIANAENVGSAPFHLRFDPEMLKLNDDPRAEKGPFLAAPGYDAQFLTAVGPGGDELIVGLSLMGARIGASGGGLLATVYFVPLRPGQTKLTFTHATVRGPDAAVMGATFLPLTLNVED